MAPCSWTIPECGCGGCVADLPPGRRASATAAASLVMWALTGRQYGLCEITVMPCSPRSSRSYQVYPVDLDVFGSAVGFHPIIEDGIWRNVGYGSCCQTGCEVDLPGPVTKANISEVTVAGVVVDADAYQVHDKHLLVRVDGGCWPACINYAATPPDFTVTYLRGDPTPQPVLDATATLLCEFGKACVGAPCRLPSRIVSMTRQGVDVQLADLTELIAQGLVGIDEIDRVILAVNPGQLRQRPQVWSPDVPMPRVVT